MTWHDFIHDFIRDISPQLRLQRSSKVLSPHLNGKVLGNECGRMDAGGISATREFHRYPAQALTGSPVKEEPGHEKTKPQVTRVKLADVLKFKQIWWPSFLWFSSPQFQPESERAVENESSLQSWCCLKALLRVSTWAQTAQEQESEIEGKRVDWMCTADVDTAIRTRPGLRRWWGMPPRRKPWRWASSWWPALCQFTSSLLFLSLSLVFS